MQQLILTSEFSLFSYQFIMFIIMMEYTCTSVVYYSLSNESNIENTFVIDVLWCHIFGLLLFTVNAIF